MPASNASYSLVLLGRFPGKDRAVAQMLSQIFNRSDSWGLQVVGASPITMLNNLTLPQAQAVYQALVEIEKAGSRFQVYKGVDESYPMVNWPSTPKINGRPVSDFSGGAPAAASQISAGEITLPCPYTGQPIVLKLLLSKAKGTQAPGIAIRASAPGVAGISAPTPRSVSASVPTPITASVPVPIPVPVSQAANTPPAPPAAPGAPPPVPLANATPNKPSTGVGPAAKPAARTAARNKPAARAGSPALEPLDVDFEELTPINDGRPAAAPPPARAARPGSARAKRASGAMPLPEVPVVDSGPGEGSDASAAPKPYLAPGILDPRFKGPMALEDFEAGLQKSAAAASPAPPEAKEKPVFAPPAPPAPPAPRSPRTSRARGPKPRRPSPAPPPSASLEEAEELLDDPEVLCSIFIGKSHNPKVHALVAEIQGITTEEAQRHCQKAVVPIVKDIPIGEAEDIKRRFRAIKVHPRVVRC